MTHGSANKIRVMFAGGGTGGHLYPALAIAEGLKRALLPRSCEIRFVGSKRGIEYRRRDELGFPLDLIPVRPLARKLTVKNLLFPFALAGALLKSNALLNNYQPDLVVGTGGYVSGPVLSRAAALHIPCAIQEQNSFPGLTTRKLATKVDRVYLGFDDARQYLKGSAEIKFTGNPVRSEIGRINRVVGCEYFNLDPEKQTALILGGSQGAHSVNESVLRAISELPENMQLLWQSGNSDFENVQTQLRALPSLSRRVKALAFTDKIEYAYACADIAIARAGALTLAELQAAELPAVLIPYPFAAGDHQRKNAESIVTTGAAEMILDSRLTEDNPLERAIAILAENRTEAMTNAWKTLNSQRENSALNCIVTDLTKLLESRGRLA